jgi:hypothetical protein
MATTTGRLSERKLKEIKPGKARRRYADGGGLGLIVYRTGTRTWRAERRISGGKRVSVLLGHYPKMGLKAAREACAAERAKADRAARMEAAKRSWPGTSTGTFWWPSSDTFFNLVRTPGCPLPYNYNWKEADILPFLAGLKGKAKRPAARPGKGK